MKCISASPALDVLGVGLQDGRVVLHNLRYDEEVATFHNAAAAGTAAGRFLQGSAAAIAVAASSSAVSCISFSTGGWWCAALLLMVTHSKADFFCHSKWVKRTALHRA